MTKTDCHLFQIATYCHPTSVWIDIQDGMDLGALQYFCDLGIVAIATHQLLNKSREQFRRGILPGMHTACDQEPTLGRG